MANMYGSEPYAARLEGSSPSSSTDTLKGGRTRVPARAISGGFNSRRPHKSMDIFKEVKKLEFPEGKYVVVGSGPMVAHQIRESHDIDIVVSQKIFDACKNSGVWEILPWTYEKPGQVYLKKDRIELYIDVNCQDFNPTTKELIQRSQIVNGVPFASLGDTIRFKTEYAKSNKPKHLADITLIENYIKKQTQNKINKKIKTNLHA